MSKEKATVHIDPKTAAAIVRSDMEVTDLHGGSGLGAELSVKDFAAAVENGTLPLTVVIHGP